ncbi:uncharacterized protein LOC106510078 isoform X1 [Sus scrofa]|uniref:uncharacterized protein LOC106510078 isoform X1 n=1 Tax=Sus scrofa TaxID=9823 RepID=UPI0006B174E4|nr:uncharacterized protein LOC106510078 isoform X1 [Sus scrofa]
MLLGGRAAGRDRDGRDQTMSCIHGGLGQSQAGASRPLAAPPATTRAGGKPGLRAAICGHPQAGGRAPTAPRPGAGGSGRRAPWRPPGQGSRSERRTRRPLRLERGAVPLRRASSRAEERVGGPAAGGSDIRATGLATMTAPGAAPSPCGTPGWLRPGRNNVCSLCGEILDQWLLFSANGQKCSF